MLRLLSLGLIAIGLYYTEACKYIDQEHAIGDVWTAVDGCNQCVCGIVGSICTKRICVDTPPMTTASQPAPKTDTAAQTPCVVVATDGTQMTYKAGESFKSPDGCNTCMCAANGRSLCTLMMCIKEPECTDSSTGKTYSVGQSFPSSDGCNTCQCFDAGISCTKIFCNSTPKPTNVCTDGSGAIHKDGEMYKAADGCNTCTCMKGSAACTEMACMKTEQCFDKFTLTLHNNGDKFQAPDGCNSCSCTSGVISCTKTIC